MAAAEIKYFRCMKCGYQFISAQLCDLSFRCGAVIDYIYADDPDMSNDEIMRSIGIKPLGCGGKIKEITQNEANNVR